MKIFILVFSSLLVCCAQSPVKNQKTAQASVQKSPIAKLNKKSGKTTVRAAAADTQEFKREQQMVLRRKPSLATRPLAAAVNPQNKRLVLDLKSNLNASPNISEAKLMAELQEQFDLNNEIGFQSRYQAFQQRFPKSGRINEAHYMAGLLSLSYKNYGRALRSFDAVLKNPRGPQASKAMFAKAMTYRRMNLGEPSKQLLVQVQTRYPKTLEAQRAAIELRIADKRFQ
ncbi:MAG: tetratricopeptide repeat protein [Bdellovibrio sp.]|jgi:hypothetical protein